MRARALTILLSFCCHARLSFAGAAVAAAEMSGLRFPPPHGGSSSAPQMCWVESIYVRRLLVLDQGLRPAGRRPHRGGPGRAGTLAGLPEQAELSSQATRALSSPAAWTDGSLPKRYTMAIVCIMRFGGRAKRSNKKR
jgi:hypothetical protein